MAEAARLHVDHQQLTLYVHIAWVGAATAIHKAAQGRQLSLIVDTMSCPRLARVRLVRACTGRPQIASLGRDGEQGSAGGSGLRYAGVFSTQARLYYLLDQC